MAPGKMENLFHVDPTCENRFNIEVSEEERGVGWGWEELDSWSL